MTLTAVRCSRQDLAHPNYPSKPSSRQAFPQPELSSIKRTMSPRRGSSGGGTFSLLLYSDFSVVKTGGQPLLKFNRRYRSRHSRNFSPTEKRDETEEIRGQKTPRKRVKTIKRLKLKGASSLCKRARMYSATPERKLRGSRRGTSPLGNFSQASS